jgi:hypothetical protein
LGRRVGPLAQILGSSLALELRLVGEADGVDDEVEALGPGLVEGGKDRVESACGRAAAS